MSSSKIKVDPRTFKIINQAQSQAKSQSQTTTESFTSDSESSTSVNSDTESVKVIKLDSSEQSGGLAKSNGPSITGSEVRIQPSQDRIIKPAVPNPPATNPPATNPPATNPPASKPSTPNPTASKQSVPTNTNISNNDLFSYLSINNPNQSSIGQESPLSKLEESIGTEDTDNTVTTSKTGELQTSLAEEEVQSAEQQVEDTTQDVFDLTQNKLYQVLSKLFEDTKGNNISENIEKLSKLFESHNQIMEKMLSQLIIMNTNYKQVKVPESVQTSTKQAGNIIDFRKKLDQLDQKEQKKP
jgi:hypothetical protein